MALVPNENIVWLQIAMNDAVFVNQIDRGHNLCKVEARCIKAQGADMIPTARSRPVRLTLLESVSMRRMRRFA